MKKNCKVSNFDVMLTLTDWEMKSNEWFMFSKDLKEDIYYQKILNYNLILIYKRSENNFGENIIWIYL